jgi:hypothetical protein
VLPVPVPAGGLAPVVVELVLKERNRKDGLHYGKRHLNRNVKKIFLLQHPYRYTNYTINNCQLYN